MNIDSQLIASNLRALMPFGDPEGTRDGTNHLAALAGEVEDSRYLEAAKEVVAVAVVATAAAVAATTLVCRSLHQLRNTLLGMSKELEACMCKSRWLHHRKSTCTSLCSPLWSKIAIDHHLFGSRRHHHVVQNQRGGAVLQASPCASSHISSSLEESLASCAQHHRKT